MRIVALETTERVGGVAALVDGDVAEQLQLNPDQRSAQSLAPAVRQLLRTLAWRAADVDLVAVAAGPGSFTGLRVGVTTAKTFAYATGAQVLGLNTLEVIAAEAPPSVAAICVVMDAQREQVFSGRLARDDTGRFQWREETRVVDVQAWLAGLGGGEVVAGPGLVKLAGRLPPQVTALEEHLWAPRAATVGRLAFEHHRAGRRDDLWQLVPQYFRKSAAEEKWEQRQSP